MKPILLVEDNPDDVFFLKRALKGAAIRNPLIVMEDGDAPIEYLTESLKNPDDVLHRLPMLVLMDLHLPGKSGFEVLRWIRAQPSLATLPVVAMVTSTLVPDAEQAPILGASLVLTKPIHPADLLGLKDGLSLTSLEIAHAP